MTAPLDRSTVTVPVSYKSTSCLALNSPIISSKSIDDSTKSPTVGSDSLSWPIARASSVSDEVVIAVQTPTSCDANQLGLVADLLRGKLLKVRVKVGRVIVFRPEFGYPETPVSSPQLTTSVLSVDNFLGLLTDGDCVPVGSDELVVEVV